jgi:chromosome segregation ATPase
MWLFGKKKKKKNEEDSDGDEEEEDNTIPEDAALGSKVEMMTAQLTKLSGTVESLKEMRKSTSERFATINEQMGEMRGMVTDVQRAVGSIDVKATKAADLVESVQPDKLMIQVQKEDGKIEGLRGLLEAKEEMMKNLMEQVRKLRDQMKIFTGVEQVIKMNQEVKEEIMGVKKLLGEVERHADRVDNVFIEAQKSFESFNTFADKLDDLKSELKDLTAKVDKLEVVNITFLKKSEFDEKFQKIEKSDKKVRVMLDKVEEFYKKLGERFKKMELQLRAEFEFKIEKAEILSKSFDDLLKENPLFADGLRLQDYLDKHLVGEAKKLKEVTEAPAEVAESSAEAETEKEPEGEGEKK